MGRGAGFLAAIAVAMIGHAERRTGFKFRAATQATAAQRATGFGRRGIGQDIRVIARFKGVVPGQVVGDPVPDGGRCGKDMHHGPGLWVGIEAACGNIDCIAIAG